MRDASGKSASRVAPLRACADGFLRARAQQLRRAGDRAQEPRPRPAYLLRAHPRARHRTRAVHLDAAELSLRLPPRLCGGDVHRDSTEPGTASVTPVAEILRAEIERNGPVTFHRFMEAA